MSRTYRAPPPRRRLRAGYVARLCWHCRYPVAVCDCPARALVVRAVTRAEIDHEAARALEPWTPESGDPCPCDACNTPPWDDNTPPLTQPLAALLAA